LLSVVETYVVHLCITNYQQTIIFARYILLLSHFSVYLLITPVSVVVKTPIFTCPHVNQVDLNIRVHVE